MPDSALAPRRFSLLDSLGETANHRNAMLLVQLRWLAVFGQAFTVVVARIAFDPNLPLVAMFGVIGLLVLFNLFSMLRPRASGQVRDIELAGELLFDITALTALLYFSGGATNPFVFIYVLPVTLGAILLERRTRWALALYAIAAFAVLTEWHLPLTVFPDGAALQAHVYGLFICFALDLLLLVFFMDRIGSNLRRRDRNLADLRQRAAEEDHIVRMGLLASGAAHELGTPLATLSVLIGDWKRLPAFRDDRMLREELDEADTELRRIKGIVGGILMSAGEARGERPVLTTPARFLEATLDEWRATSPQVSVEKTLQRPLDEHAWLRTPIVADSALRQVLFNVLDNARDVSPQWIGVEFSCRDGRIGISVIDRGPGFSDEIRARIGRPYHSTKGRPGGGLGLFLVVNVLRKLGGTVSVDNRPEGGARVQLCLPLRRLVVDDHRQAESLPS